VLCGIGFGGVATLYVPILIRSYDSEPAVAVVSVFNVSLGVFALGLPPLGMALFAYADSYQAPVALTIVVPPSPLTIAWSGFHLRTGGIDRVDRRRRSPEK